MVNFPHLFSILEWLIFHFILTWRTDQSWLMTVPKRMPQKTVPICPMGSRWSLPPSRDTAEGYSLQVRYTPWYRYALRSMVWNISWCLFVWVWYVILEIKFKLLFQLVTCRLIVFLVVYFLVVFRLFIGRSGTVCQMFMVCLVIVHGMFVDCS